jgi:hypothetical protein
MESCGALSVRKRHIRALLQQLAAERPVAKRCGLQQAERRRRRSAPSSAVAAVPIAAVNACPAPLLALALLLFSSTLGLRGFVFVFAHLLSPCWWKQLPLDMQCA